MSFAGETLSNTFDFAYKLTRVKELQELPQIQSELINRQAQLLGDQTEQLGERIMQVAQDAAKAGREATAQAARRRPEAA